MRVNILSCLTVSVIMYVNATDGAVFSAGRPKEDERDFTMRFSGGAVIELEALVQETTRKLYDVTGETYKQDTREDYNLNDFDMEGPYPSIGIGMESCWKYITLDISSTFIKSDISTVAKRNYYIGVGDKIEYEGAEYSNMKIPTGTPFTVDLVSGIFDLDCYITPFTINLGQSLRITPSIDLGLLLFAGQYDIDAGPVTGWTTYMNPPEYFAVGGESSGLVGLVVPQAGLGTEIRIGRPDGVNFLVSGHCMVLQYDGTTEYFTTSDHREKNLDINHVNYKGRAAFEFPLASGRCITIGAEYRSVETSASITAASSTEEEVLANRERFDKEAAFRMQSADAFIGITF